MLRDYSTGVAIQRVDQNVDLKVSSLWFRSQSKNVSISCYLSKFCSRHSAKALVLSVVSRIVEFCYGKASTTLSPYFGWSVHSCTLASGMAASLVVCICIFKVLALTQT